MRDLLARPRDAARLLLVSARLVAGRRFYVALLLPLAWPLYLFVYALLGGGEGEPYSPVHAQNLVIGFPLAMLAIGLGVRIIAADAERRTLEIAYTVPGGASKAWLFKSAAALLLLLAAEALLAVAALVFFTDFPPGALYGALQAAMFYFAVAMALSTLFRGEITGSLASAVVLAFGLLLSDARVRFSPFWNPLTLREADPAELFAWTLQNRVGFVLAIAGLFALTFGRAERREKML
ncbi:MAG: hypothetical protein KBD01_07810 [Acidobacteria bacterium]|nr:hypothetical protein [Acidobacteriota bacterium]